MSKQSSIEWLWHNLTDDLIGDLPNETIYKIYNLVLQAKQMHQEEIKDAFNNGMVNSVDWFNDGIKEESEQYYQETYGGNTK